MASRIRGVGALLALAAIAVVARVGAHATPDASWLLYATERWLGGARLGTDLADASPPVILWIKVPAVLIAGVVGISTWASWVLFVTLGALASSVAASQLLALHEDWESPPARRRAMVASAAVLLLVPTYDFGQREHIALILTLPWVLMAGVIGEGHRIPRALALGLSVVAGFGMSIKPHFALLWLAVVVYQWAVLRGSIVRHLIRRENVTAALTGIGLAMVVAISSPAWLEYALTHWALYSRYIAVNPVLVGLTGPGAGVGIFALLAWWLLRPHMLSRRWTADALVVAMVAFHLAAAIQGKGFPYHFLPTLCTGVLLGALLWATIRRPLPGLARPAYSAAALAVSCAGVVLGLFYVGSHMAGRSPARPDLDPVIDQLVEALGTESDHPRTVGVLSTSIASGFPLVTETGVTWTSRHSGLWMLSALYDDQLFQGRMATIRPPNGRPPAEQRMVDELYEDLLLRPPDVILVVAPDPAFNGWAGARQFDYVALLSAEKRFEDLLSRYQDAGEVGYYRILRRIDPVNAASALQPVKPPTDRSGRTHALPPFTLSVSGPALLLLGLFFALGLAWETAQKRKVQPG